MKEANVEFYGAPFHFANTKQFLHALLCTQHWVHKSSAKQDCSFGSGSCCCTDPQYLWLMELFSLWLVSGTVLDMVKECQTVLISKSALPECENDINNWRLITVGSTIMRLFSRVLMARLTKACSINPQQKGLIRSSECEENLKLLQLLIQNAKKEHWPLGVVFVDLAKAFDTVASNIQTTVVCHTVRPDWKLHS